MPVEKYPEIITGISTADIQVGRSMISHLRTVLTLMVMFYRFPRLLPRSWRGPSLRWEPLVTWPRCRTSTPCNLGHCDQPDHPLVNLQSLSVETNILSYLKHFAEIFMKINRHRNNSVCVKYTLWNKYTCTL